MKSLGIIGAAVGALIALPSDATDLPTLVHLNTVLGCSSFHMRLNTPDTKDGRPTLTIFETCDDLNEGNPKSVRGDFLSQYYQVELDCARQLYYVRWRKTFSRQFWQGRQTETGSEYSYPNSLEGNPENQLVPLAWACDPIRRGKPTT